LLKSPFAPFAQILKTERVFPVSGGVGLILEGIRSNGAAGGAQSLGFGRIVRRWLKVGSDSVKNGTLRRWCGRDTAAVHRLDGSGRRTHAQTAQFTAQIGFRCVV